MKRTLAVALFSLILPTSASFAQEYVVTKDGQKLTAKWAIPSGQVQSVALILQGSGNVGTDGDVSSPFVGTGYEGRPAKLSDQIAEALAAKGIASLRYAKRGVDDPNQAPNQKFPFLEQDADSAMKMLRARFPGKPLSLVGLSEGALIATLLASKNDVDGLFLMSPPLRRLDEVIGYQFMEWPMNLVMAKLSPANGTVSTQQEIFQESSFQLPLADTAKIVGLDFSAKTLDANQDHLISIKDELLPAYQKLYQAVLGLLQSPGFKGWYDSYMALPDMTSVMGAIRAKSLFIYQGMDDSQIKWSWIVEDSHYFKIAPTLRLHTDLSHCFAPMSGALNSIKASGPIQAQVLEGLTQDVSTIR